MKNKLTAQKISLILRIAGFVLAAFFLATLQRGGDTMPKEGFMGTTFCNLMTAIGALIFTIGSLLRFREVMKKNKNNELPQ